MIGRGNHHEATGRDFSYCPNDEVASEASFSSLVWDSQGDIDDRNIIDGSRGRTSASGGARVPHPDDLEHFEGDELFEDQDLMEVLLDEMELARPPSQHSLVTTPSGFSAESHDSMVQFASRPSSTKMRAATLAYLAQFADRPRALRNEFRRLRREKDLMVVHLCGCGLCSAAPDGTKVLGCTEPSHLRLGTSAENLAHSSFHTTIRSFPAEAFPDMCRWMHTTVYGKDVF